MKHIEELLVESRGDSFDDDPGGDYDPMYDGHGSDAPKCGGRLRETSWGGLEGGCPGCKHCDPVDYECKPYGFGIESFEDPALAEANAAMWAEIDKRGAGKYTSAWLEDWGMYAGRSLKSIRPTKADRELRDFCWRFWSKHSKRRERHSNIVWERICNECETHTEAVTKYKAWAKRAVTIRYRDEK